MIKELPLYPGAQRCVRSGFCCRQAPCGFGESISQDNKQCKYLEKGADGRFQCGIAEEIVRDPSWILSPAFGAGCCSPMFNPDREAILRELRATASNSTGGDQGLPEKHL